MKTLCSKLSASHERIRQTHFASFNLPGYVDGINRERQQTRKQKECKYLCSSRKRKKKGSSQLFKINFTEIVQIPDLGVSLIFSILVGGNRKAFVGDENILKTCMQRGPNGPMKSH